MSGSVAEFLDTNILVYAFSTDDRSARAEELLGRRCAVGLQGLNEFANVASRKLGMSWEEIATAVESIRVLCPTILPLDVETHGRALQVAARYRLSFYDSLMISAALQGGCEILWSEDMQHGLFIEDRLRILDPFSP
jgi:predicted nucleic acid-binding protein